MLRRNYAAFRKAGLSKSLQRAWSSSTSLGLRCDLANLPPRREAKIPLLMKPAQSATEAGLLAEFEADRSNEEAANRVALCDAGVTQLYVARDESDSACYAQWLIHPSEHHRIEAHNPGLYPPLKENQVLLEGAYTYTDFRRLGAMADGMHQLLEIARDEGATEAFTYVAAEYLPSIRGCANVGFELDHMRRSQRRLLWRNLQFMPADESAREAWNTATAR